MSVMSVEAYGRIKAEASLELHQSKHGVEKIGSAVCADLREKLNNIESKQITC